MISCIICSRQPDISDELKENIKSTIGCDYELVVIDNSANKYSIFSAYNEGVRRAKGDILCFMHEDVLFRSNNWGGIVRNLLDDKSIGLLGVFGSHFMSSAPLYWWDSPYISQYSINTNNGHQEMQEHTCFYHNGLADVAVVDGVCIFANRNIFNYISFDAEHYDGFHAYDVDLSMQVQAKNMRVCVTKEVLIEHFWCERLMYDKRYAAMLDRNMRVFATKWSTSLPIVRGIDMPEDILCRLNNLCKEAYAARSIRQSKSYQLGKFLLKPINKVICCR